MELVTSAMPAIASLVAIAVSVKTNNNANKIQKEINKLQLISEDKQRLIEVISSQRVEWINNLRECFVRFNTDAYIYSSFITQMIIQKREATEDVNNLIPRMINEIKMIELHLNPTEIVAKKQIRSMNKIMNIFTEFTQYYNELSGNPEKVKKLKKVVQTTYQKERKYMMYLQQVILKVEWKRVKTETEEGRQISSREMNCMFEETAKKIDEEIYVRLLKEDIKGKSYCRKDCFDEN